jgi:RHS repeat-associated protein
VDLADFLLIQPAIINGTVTPVETPIVYDYRNQMVQFTDGAGVMTAYRYDALGRRIEKVVDAGGAGETVTRFYYDGDRVVEEQDSAGATLATYVYGNYIDEVLTMRRLVEPGTPGYGGSEPGEADYWFHTDDQYSAVALTDANGAVVERYEYNDYGQPSFFDNAGTPLTATAVGNPYLYTGRRHDPETGFHWYRTRYLDPATGRFTTRDTIGTWGDPTNLGNAYSYVGNNPWFGNEPPMSSRKAFSQWKRSLDDYAMSKLSSDEPWVMFRTPEPPVDPLIFEFGHPALVHELMDSAGTIPIEPIGAAVDAIHGLEHLRVRDWSGAMVRAESHRPLSSFRAIIYRDSPIEFRSLLCARIHVFDPKAVVNDVQLRKRAVVDRVVMNTVASRSQQAIYTPKNVLNSVSWSIVGHSDLIPREASCA